MYQLAHKSLSAHIRISFDEYRRRNLEEPVNRTDLKAELREAQRRWLDRVTRHTGLTLTQIARAGGLSDSTLTRFRNREEHEGTLSTLTIRAIAQATGYPATSEVLGEDPGKPLGLREPEAEPYMSAPDDPLARAIEAFIAGRGGVDPWTLRSRALEFAGFMPGDVLIVDLNDTPRDGDVVCAQVYDFDSGRAETVFRIYEAPFLIAQGPEQASRKPLRADEGSVAIKGVVETTFRPRTARAA